MADDSTELEYKGFTIKAEYDPHGANPFIEQDGHWPMTVRSPDRLGNGGWDDYDDNLDGSAGPAVRWPLSRFDDALIVHWQVHIARIFGTTVKQMLHGLYAWEQIAPAYTTDAQTLMDAFNDLIENQRDRDVLRICSKLYKLLDIPHLLTIAHDYSHGDFSELLIVATPEAVLRLQGADWAPTDAEREQWIKESLEAQAELYRQWMCGEVYGWRVLDPDGDELDSCWGYYGDDHEASGLMEAARASIDGRLGREQEAA